MAWRFWLFLLGLVWDMSLGAGTNKSMELQTLRSALEVAKEKDQKVQAEEEHERVEAAFTSFFGTLLVICLVLALLWMHNRHQQETARLMSTIVQLNEERAKLMQKFTLQQPLLDTGKP
ncbi:unnamed protein product [Durusdinium trenchii]|uniref:Uncharacterized protein n=2 Tax=Durusdinium trenchii TaxID=1381693 RepID=A0ABP0SQL4_9DINO